MLSFNTSRYVLRYEPSLVSIWFVSCQFLVLHTHSHFIEEQEKYNDYYIITTSTLHKKWSFPLSISSVNVTKSAGNWGFGHIHWRNSWWKTSFFVQCHLPANFQSSVGCRGIFRILSEIYDGAFCENSC